MRLGYIEDLLGSAELHKSLQHFAVAHVLGLRVQLSVRKGARAPFAELYVAVLVEDMSLEESLVLPHALFHRAAPLDDERTDAAPQQADGAEQPRGAAADHDHPRRPAFDLQKGARGQRDRLFVRLYRIHPADIRLVARVQRFFEDADIAAAAHLFGGKL